MIRVTGYGQTGPYRHKAGFGTPATAFSGFTYLHGYQDRPPISPSFSLTRLYHRHLCRFSPRRRHFIIGTVKRRWQGPILSISALYESDL